MRVLQGFIDIGGQANRYAEAIRQQGHHAESWFYERTLKKEPYDRLLDFSANGFLGGRLRKIKYLKDALLKFDVWHIHKGFSMFHHAKDLMIAKKLGKKIIIHYRGREIRPEMHLDTLLKHIIEKVKRENEIADQIFVKDGQLAELISPYVERPIVFPNIVRVDHFIPPSEFPIDYFETKRKLRVVHIPSNAEYKGTAFIRQAAERLKDKIDYTELSNISHEEVLHSYWKADVIIDQLLTGTYGNASLEAMALGRCVVNYLNPVFTRFEPEIPPIVQATQESVTEVLMDLDINRSLLHARAKEGIQFIRRNHKKEEVGLKLINCYQNILTGKKA
jgi:uncharacterized protein (UPF0332 family)